ncbi:hypothetical protein BDW02DRAFT_150882 [Decorospora gaudefroyi]|uniref:Ubiquitin 3 binding protein But2 C-terminal domain-containing protein n=1 Tax=Decorospora gaudefroyi TaxID=184978 RepID=A0A6A5KT20_9PLEO|nr:hypothetical protein BDW02DRAFT_150882 [Decorospora gaudefroyi]
MRFLTLLPVLFGIPSLATHIDTLFPHLLIPLKSWEPNTAFPTEPDAYVTYSSRTGAQQWTAINFDVPNNNAIMCRLRFLVNTNFAMNAPFALYGTPDFTINISRIKPELVNGVTTWDNRPPITDFYDSYTLMQDADGKATVRENVSEWFLCPKGNVAQFVMHPGSQRDLMLYWYELDYSPENGGPHGIVLEMHT